MIRKWATTLLEVAGLALIVAGISELSPIAGLIAGGFALILLGVRLA
jgi:hypothetical protein